MFAIGHASTALLLKRAYPAVRLTALLLSVQAVELLWVAFNLLGIERTTTEPTVRYLGDIHLAYMPFSHSVATTLLLCAAAWVAAAAAGRRRLGAALALGIGSHLVLDLLTHGRDIALAPFVDGPRLGSQLYPLAPGLAFFVELGYAVFCWAVFRGERALLTVVLFFSLTNVSFFFAGLPGPERWLAGRPHLIVTVILVQIAVTLAAVGWAASRSADGRRPRVA